MTTAAGVPTTSYLPGLVCGYGYAVTALIASLDATAVTANDMVVNVDFK